MFLPQASINVSGMRNLSLVQKLTQLHVVVCTTVSSFFLDYSSLFADTFVVRVDVSTYLQHAIDHYAHYTYAQAQPGQGRIGLLVAYLRFWLIVSALMI